MATGIEQHLNPALVITHHDEGVFPDIARDKISAVGNLRFVTNEDPGLRKNSAQFQVMDRPVVKQASREKPLFQVISHICQQIPNRPIVIGQPVKLLINI
ncbi:ATP-binding protein [Croceicoccus naphthovorans]|uniref:ATP-binding protein n=1 Tax=Croceicoccus naphthovorans TaxID=1348774 RepID=UPI001FDF49F1|nr:ATP-binding protein [Croceicoccus naphthovorans]